MEYRLTEPYTKDAVRELRAGDQVRITGTIYTARDAAHKKITEMIGRGEKPPFEIEGSIIYYVGPTPAKPGNPIGSAGPTTSYRMDAYAPELLDLGQLMMIGKGQRSEEVAEAALRNGAVYAAAIGGAAAVMAQCVKTAEVIAFPELGMEALHLIKVDKYPAIIGAAHGRSIYE